METFRWNIDVRISNSTSYVSEIVRCKQRAVTVFIQIHVKAVGVRRCDAFINPGDELVQGDGNEHPIRKSADWQFAWIWVISAGHPRIDMGHAGEFVNSQLVVVLLHGPGALCCFSHRGYDDGRNVDDRNLTVIAGRQHSIVDGL